MKSWIFISSLLAFSFLVAYAQDWNWMDCHNHGYFARINGTYQCVCNKGWTGDDCAMCANDAVCAPGQVCDRSFAIKGYKAFNCTPAGADIGFLQGCFTAQWNFPPPDMNGTVPIGQGNITSYDGPIGAPFVFNCSFTDCTQGISNGVTNIQCQHTTCHCSTWCSDITRNIINQMKGQASFICWESLGNCTLTQQQLPLVLEVGCTAAGCQQGPYIPPPPIFNHSQVALIASVTTLCVVCLFAAIILSCFFSRRKQYHAFVKSRGHHFQTVLSYNGLTCSLDDGRVVLHPTSGVMTPGHVTAIMGPSGAGKTTFLDILAGRKNVGKLTGDILVNGFPKPAYFQRISGYVLQDEKFLGTFTVKEHLMFVAQLRLPSGMPKIQKEERVRSVMEELGISHIANSMIGTDTTRGISGGERKRLAIACELLTDPSLLFLDEPTSGLDSYNAFSLLQTLTNLAKDKNRNIITTIHQPRSNIYSLFDHVILISRGHTVYNGPASDVIHHFATMGYHCPENYNPADFMIDLVEERQEAVPEMAGKFRESEQFANLRNQLAAQYETVPAKMDDPFKHSQYLSTWYDQALVLSKRTILHILRNPYLLRAQYVMYSLLGALIGGIFWHVQNNLQGVQDRAGSLFFIVALISFSSLSSIDTFFHDRAIFVRERANGMYRTSSYFLAKTLCDVIPMRILPPFILGAICYYMIGFQVGYIHFLKFEAILVLVSLVSATMALAISSVSPSVGLGNLIHILMLLFSLLFGGFLVNKNSMPPWIGWLKWASFLNFAFEVLLVNELHGLIIMFDPVGYHMNPVPVAGDVFLTQFDMDINRVGLDFALLGGMTLLFAFVAYIFLRFANKERR